MSILKHIRQWRRDRHDQELIDQIAKVVVSGCDTETVASVMNGIVGCEADANLSNAEVEAGDAFLQALITQAPESVTEAQTA
jgi:hypothetical protein